MTPIAFQKQPGDPMEEHIIDLVYRPIENAMGRSLVCSLKAVTEPNRHELASDW